MSVARPNLLPMVQKNTDDVDDQDPVELALNSRQQSDFVLGREESVLLPGQVRVPQDVNPPTPMDTWNRADSSIWDAKESDNVSTPLTGYGRGDQLWGASPTSGGAEARAFPSITSGAGEGASTGNDASRPLDAGGGAIGEATTALSVDERVGDAGQEGGNDNFGFSSKDPLRESSFGFGETKRTASQDLSDELYEQASMFAPPPPPRVPKDTRRQRAELWYYYASKWDITHSQPPPPRTPLPEMEEENRQQCPQLTIAPYRGDKWLERSGHWFDWVQHHFQPKRALPASISDPDFVLESCVCE